MVSSFAPRHHYITFKKFQIANIMYYLAEEQKEWKSDLLCSLLFPTVLMLQILMGTLLRISVPRSIHLYNNACFCKYPLKFHMQAPGL